MRNSWWDFKLIILAFFGDKVYNITCEQINMFQLKKNGGLTKVEYFSKFI